MIEGGRGIDRRHNLLSRRNGHRGGYSAVILAFRGQLVRVEELLTIRILLLVFAVRNKMARGSDGPFTSSISISSDPFLLYAAKFGLGFRPMAEVRIRLITGVWGSDVSMRYFPEMSLERKISRKSVRPSSGMD